MVEDLLKDDLLDKHERRELQFLHEIYINGGEAQTGYLLDKLAICASSLKKTAESVNLRLQNYCHKDLIGYSKSNNTYHFTSKEQFNLERITGEYLTTSLNYFILRTFLENENVDPDTLWERLLISRADFYRRIKRINDVIKEFGVYIKNYQLQGQEIQIRYFSQLFYQHIYPEKYLVYDAYHYAKFEPLFVQLEHYYGASLNSIQKAKLSLWLSIMSKRIRRSRKSAAIPQFILEYVDDNPFYKEIAVILTDFFKQDNIKLQKMDLISTYLFSLSLFIAPYSSEKVHNIILFSFTRNDIVAKTIREMNKNAGGNFIHLNETTTIEFFYNYYIFNFHHQVIFFRGCLFHVNSTLLHFYQSYNYKEVAVRSWANNVCSNGNFKMTYLSHNKEFLFHKYMLYVYHEQSLVQLPLRVGVSLFTDPLMELMAVERLQTDLSKDHNVRVERYSEEHFYDLVVVNIPRLLTARNYENEFVISGMGTPTDRLNIGKKLTVLQQKRIELEFV